MENSEWIFDTCGRLWRDSRNLVEPDSVVENHDAEEIERAFENEGFRYWSQKADAWRTIAGTLYHDFNSNPLNIFETHDYDAIDVLDYVQNEDPAGFPQIKGPKLSRTWIKYIDRDVRTLENLEKVPIPTDVHIVEITNKLTGSSYSVESKQDQQEVQQFWRELGSEYGIAPLRIDSPLWRIHRNWDEFGEDYLMGLMRD